MKLGELLNEKELKHRPAVTVAPSDTITHVIQKLVAFDIGSLPVCNEKGNLVGIITERDVVRKALNHIKDFKGLRVVDIMSQKVAIGTPDDDIAYAISVMKQQKIRHLPILDKQKVVGMISMRDLLGFQLEESEERVRFLSDYISGGYV